MRKPNGPAPRSIARFPSEAHYENLKTKGFADRVVDEDLWAWHAYDYGWRRIMLQTRDDNSPIDPQRQWFDAEMATKAELFYSTKFHRKCPPLVSAAPPQHSPRPPEELAYVEDRMREIRANVAMFEARNRAAMKVAGAGELESDRGALQRVREELGVTATEAPNTDHNGGSNEHSQHDQEVLQKSRMSKKFGT
jgi:hypothetical protein